MRRPSNRRRRSSSIRRKIGLGGAAAALDEQQFVAPPGLGAEPDDPRLASIASSGRTT